MRVNAVDDSDCLPASVVYFHPAYRPFDELSDFVVQADLIERAAAVGHDSDARPDLGGNFRTSLEDDKVDARLLKHVGHREAGDPGACHYDPKVPGVHDGRDLDKLAGTLADG